MIAGGMLAFFIQAALAKVPCANYGFRDYSYQKHYAGEDQYYNAAAGITLKVKCLSKTTTFEQAIEKLKTESAARNTQGDAVYFESNEHGRMRRIYIVDRKPVVQLTFSAKRRHRAALDSTQPLIEKYYKKTKLTFSP